MNFDMIANTKMDSASAIDLLMNIIHDEVVVELGPEDIDTTLKAFIDSYVKLKKHIAVYRDTIEKEQILEKLMDDMINKIDGDSYMKPIIIKKINKTILDVYNVKLC